MSIILPPQGLKEPNLMKLVALKTNWHFSESGPVEYCGRTTIDPSTFHPKDSLQETF